MYATDFNVTAIGYSIDFLVVTMLLSSYDSIYFDFTSSITLISVIKMIINSTYLIHYIRSIQSGYLLVAWPTSL